MATFEEQLAILLGDHGRPRILEPEVNRRPGGLTPSNGDGPGQLGALPNIYGRLELIAQLLGVIGPAANPAFRVSVSKSENDPYNGSIQEAIDSIPTTGDDAPSDTQRWVVMVAPGVYVENVVVPEYVYLVALSVGPSEATTITSASGDTITTNGAGGLFGFTISTTSAAAADAAIHALPGTAVDQTVFSVLNNVVTGAAGRCLYVDGAPVNFTSIFTGWGTDAIGAAPVAVEVAGGASFQVFFSVMFSEANTTLLVTTGSFAFLEDVTLSCDPGGTGWAVDVDGGTFIAPANVTLLDRANGLRLRGGSFGLIWDWGAITDAITTELEVDVASFAFLDRWHPRTSGVDAYAAWVIAGTVAFQPTTDWSSGTALGPDTRPPNPRPGMRFFASDVGGGLVLTFVPGVGWIDPTGAVIP